MNSQDQQAHTLDVLNRLRTAERRSLLPRLVEMDIFVQGALGHEMDQVRRMVVEQARHEAWLIEAAETCDGALFPAAADVHTASLHFLDLNSLLPRVLSSTDAIVQLYGQALADAANLMPAAIEAITRIHNRHQVHLQQLREIQARLQSPQPA